MFATRAGSSMLAAARDSVPTTEERLLELERESEAECSEWQTAIGQREEEDRHYAKRKQECQKVKDAVRAAVSSIGGNGEDIETQIQALRDWQRQRERKLSEHNRNTAKWDELQKLLGERSLNEVASEARHLHEDARARVAGIDDSILAVARAHAVTADRLSTLAQVYQAADYLVTNE